LADASAARAALKEPSLYSRLGVEASEGLGQIILIEQPKRLVADCALRNIDAQSTNIQV